MYHQNVNLARRSQNVPPIIIAFTLKLIAVIRRRKYAPLILFYSEKEISLVPVLIFWYDLSNEKRAVDLVRGMLGDSKG